MECFKKHQYVSVLSLPFNLLNFVPKVDKQNNIMNKLKKFNKVLIITNLKMCVCVCVCVADDDWTVVN